MSAESAKPLPQPPPTPALLGPATSSLPPILDTPAGLGGQGRYSNRFVHLGDSHPSWSVWSNDPEKMQMEAYFSADPETPSVGSQFNMNLKPVLVRQDSGAGDTFLLADDRGGFLLWNENELEMYRFAARDGKALLVEDVATRVRGETYTNDELVRQFWNPSGRA